MTTANPSIWFAFVAGLLSFLSPCCLPLYPSYISYISGITYQTDSHSITAAVRGRALSHSFCFVMGFSVIFLTLGLSAQTIGRLFQENRILISQVGGVIVTAMGLFMIGILKWDSLMKERKWRIQAKPASYVGAFLVGISFAAGWTPCVGPVLASVLVVAATQPINGIVLMLFYIFGFSIPFLLVAYTLGSANWLRRNASVISKLGGFCLVLMGILLYFNQMTRITIWLTQLFAN